MSKTIDTLQELIQKEDWEAIVKNFYPSDIVKMLSFKKALVLSKNIFEEKLFDDEFQTYAENLVNTIKKTFPNEWNSNWKHEAYLGYVYFRGWNCEGQFDAYKRAAELAGFPHPEVMIRQVLMWTYPGVYKTKITEEQVIEILESALKETPYIEGAGCLSSLYKDLGQEEKAAYWKEVEKESEKKGIFIRNTYLDFFKEYEKE